MIVVTETKTQIICRSLLAIVLAPVVMTLLIPCWAIWIVASVLQRKAAV